MSIEIETPTQKPKAYIPMRPSAERYNPNSKLRPPRASPVPPSEYTAAKLKTAFPGFSGTWCQPNPFLDSKPADQASSSGEKSKAPLVKPASLQPRVRDENDLSIVSPSHDPNPPVANIGKKNTRFSSITRPKTRLGFQPHMYQDAPGLVHASSSSAGSASEPKAMAINAQGSLTSMPHGSTQPTMQFPHSTNLTDLFSGHGRLPAPVISQQTMPRTTRFASASRGRAPAEPKANEGPAPLDERQLVNSVHVLQTRVDELELEKKETATRRRSDSANAAAEEEKAKAIVERLSQENQGLAQENDGLTQELEGLYQENESLAQKNDCLTQENEGLMQEKKGESESTPPHLCTFIDMVTDLEATCTRVWQERDSIHGKVMRAHTQLLAAEQEVEEKTSELDAQSSQIEQLQHENASLRQQLEVSQSENQGLTQGNSALRAENDDLKARLRALTHTSGAQQTDVTEFSKLSPDDTEGPIDMDTLSRFEHGYKIINGNRVKISELESQAALRQSKSELKPQVSLQQPESSHDLTYLSHDGDSMIKKVRKTLEAERRARHHLRQTKADEKPLVNGTNKEQAPSTQGLDDDSHHSSELSSVITTRTRQTSKPREELTSGYIVPDITMSPRETIDPEPSVPTTENHKSPVNVSQRSDTGTAERSDVGLQASQEQFALLPLEQVRSQLPTISDEELDITIQSEDSTMRPSQSPESAVAAISESVKGELASQRSQLAKYQADYDRQDIELRWRQRKALAKKIRDIQQSIEHKADQLYNLRDITESQKTSRGGLVPHHQLDNSGQSAGVQTPWQGIRSSSSRSSRSV
ncbi:MAG: hypothetical protein Q9174_004450 [Haloplaca sp. 1 TL-2023]